MRLIFRSIKQLWARWGPKPPTCTVCGQFTPARMLDDGVCLFCEAVKDISAVEDVELTRNPRVTHREQPELVTHHPADRGPR
jgi:hypothetical protein